MKAALLTEINKPLKITDLMWHKPSYGQVLVHVLSSGICGAQLNEIRGYKGTHFPRLMGHEGVGIVREAGVGVTTVKVGDKVIMHWRKGAGIESEPPKYDLLSHEMDVSTITGGQVVTFSEFSVCSENRLTTVQSDTPNDLCALLGCGLSTALATIEHEVNLKFGERILIIGCGGLGLNLILASKLAQASRIVASDVVGAKMASAIAAGAHSFSAAGFGISEEFDVVIDTTGDTETINDSFQHLAPSGRFIMVGQPKPRVSLTIQDPVRMFDGSGKSIKATQGGGFNPDTDIPRYVAMHAAGLLNIEGIITSRIPLSRINEGIDLVKSGLAGRVMIELSERQW